jgi:hypothetical protein
VLKYTERNRVCRSELAINGSPVVSDAPWGYQIVNDTSFFACRQLGVLRAGGDPQFISCNSPYGGITDFGPRPGSLYGLHRQQSYDRRSKLDGYAGLRPSQPVRHRGILDKSHGNPRIDRIPGVLLLRCRASSSPIRNLTVIHSREVRRFRATSKSILPWKWKCGYRVRRNRERGCSWPARWRCLLDGGSPVPDRRGLPGRYCAPESLRYSSYQVNYRQWSGDTLRSIRGRHPPGVSDDY